MAGLLISGPAGAGKSAAARAELQQRRGLAVAVDFQSLYSALLLLERLPNGRYPNREAIDGHIMPIAEYTRRAAITAAVTNEIFVIATNSDGDPTRRATLLGLLGQPSNEQVIDPGRAIVEDRLRIDGELTEDCTNAINRWYGRL